VRWVLDWIEVWRADVTKVLCSAEEQQEVLAPIEAQRDDVTEVPFSENDQQVLAPTIPPGPIQPGRKKNARKLELVRRAIQQAYPEGVPDQVEESNKSLCQRVVEELKKLTPAGKSDVSDDTILRAAARRK
jgi:hypothetical protein